MIRAVCDANVIISALLTPKRKPAQLLRLADQGAFELHLSDEILDEIADVLSRPRIRKLLGASLSREDLSGFLMDLTGGYEEARSVPPVELVDNDPKDNHVVAAAIFTGATYLVSGDKKHILPLRDHPRLKDLGIRVVSPAEFLNVLKQTG